MSSLHATATEIPVAPPPSDPHDVSTIMAIDLATAELTRAMRQFCEVAGVVPQDYTVNFLVQTVIAGLDPINLRRAEAITKALVIGKVQGVAAEIASSPKVDDHSCRHLMVEVLNDMAFSLRSLGPYAIETYFKALHREDR